MTLKLNKQTHTYIGHSEYITNRYVVRMCGEYVLAYNFRVVLKYILQCIKLPSTSKRTLFSLCTILRAQVLVCIKSFPRSNYKLFQSVQQRQSGNALVTRSNTLTVFYTVKWREQVILRLSNFNENISFIFTLINYMIEYSCQTNQHFFFYFIY